MNLVRQCLRLLVPLVAAAAVLVPTAQAQDAKTIRVGVMKIAALADAFLAQEQGLFKKHGINVELVMIRSGAEGITAMQGGDVDMTLAIASFAMAANERGFDLACVFQNEIAHAAPPDTGGVLVRKDSDIKTLADLAGKVVGLNALHAQEAVSAQYLIRKADVPDNKVRYVEVPFPSMADVLQRGQIDAAVAIDPFTTMIQQRGVGRVVSWMYVESVPEQPVGTFWAKRPWAEKNEKALDAFAAAMKEAMDYLTADPARARTLISKYTRLPPDLVEAMPLIAWSYKVDVDKWRDLIAMLRSQKELQKDHKPEEYFSSRLLRQVGSHP